MGVVSYDHKSMIKSNELLTNENNFLKKEIENKNMQIEHLMEMLNHQSNNTTDCIKTEKVYDAMSESYGSSIANESLSQTDILNCSISKDIATQLINIRKQHHKKYNEIKSKIKVPENINSSDKKKKNVKDNSFDTDKTLPKKWKKNTTLIVGDSIISGIEEKRISLNNVVKVRTFVGASTHYMKDYIKPLLKKCPTTIFLHIGTNNAINETSREIL